LLLVHSAFSEPGEETLELSGDIGLQAGGELMRFADGTESGVFALGLGNLFLEWSPGEAARILSQTWAEGEYSSGIQALTLGTLLEGTLRLARSLRAIGVLEGLWAEGLDEFRDDYRISTEMKVSWDLVPTILTTEAGYRFDYDEIHRIPIHERCHRIFASAFWIAGFDPLVSVRLEGFAEFIESTLREEARRSGGAAVMLTVEEEGSFGLSLFVQYRYDGFRTGGFAHTLLAAAETEFPLSETVSLLLAYKCMMNRTTVREDRFDQHRLSGGLRFVF
jgi:hypothetical protein